MLLDMGVTLRNKPRSNIMGCRVHLICFHLVGCIARNSYSFLWLSTMVVSFCKSLKLSIRHECFLVACVPMFFICCPASHFSSEHISKEYFIQGHVSCFNIVYSSRTHSFFLQKAWCKYLKVEKKAGPTTIAVNGDQWTPGQGWLQRYTGLPRTREASYQAHVAH